MDYCKICGSENFRNTILGGIEALSVSICETCGNIWKQNRELPPVLVKKLHEDALIPFRASSGAAGYDLAAVETVVIPSGEIRLVPTGIAVSLPSNTELQVRGRSGYSKKGLIIANAPGTVDSDYTGQIFVMFLNTRKDDWTVEKGDRIAQALITTKLPYAFNIVDELERTERGDGMLGSTGK